MRDEIRSLINVISLLIISYNSYLSVNLRLMIIAPDKITTPANTSAAPVASPVNGRPGSSSVVDVEPEFSGSPGVVVVVVLGVTFVDSVVVVVVDSGVVVSDKNGTSGVVVLVVES